ncbi:MAG: hypothetical protein ACREQI_00845 [Candidatus Binataceae bacterium]
MAVKSAAIIAAAGLIAAVALFPIKVRAIEVKKDLYSKGGGMAPISRIPPSLAKQLNETVAEETDPYVSVEIEQKTSGKSYVDLEHAKFVYVPRMIDGTWNVQGSLEGTEYYPPKGGGTGLGKQTGRRQALVFSYEYEGGKWVETENPKWVVMRSASTAAK